MSVLCSSLKICKFVERAILVSLASTVIMMFWVLYPVSLSTVHQSVVPFISQLVLLLTVSSHALRFRKNVNCAQKFLILAEPDGL